MTKIICGSLFVAFCGSLAALSASPPIIGMARSGGAFLINNAAVPGNATILEGTSVQTINASSDIALATGERLTLASASAATLYQGRVVLQSGAAEINHLSRYSIQARNFRISGLDFEARVRVVIEPSNRVEVAALRGNAEVRTVQGLLMARLEPGMSLEFRTERADSTSLTGTVQAKAGKFYLTDDVTKVRVEIRGPGLKALAGQRAQVTGTVAATETAADGAAWVLLVEQATKLTAAAVAAGAGTAGATGGTAAAGAAAATGISTTVIAVAAGIATAGTLGGLAATGAIGGSDASVSR